MHHQFLDAAGFQGAGAVESPAGVGDAQTHLGGDGYAPRHRVAHRRCDTLQQFGLVQQRRATAMAIAQSAQSVQSVQSVQLDPEAAMVSIHSDPKASTCQRRTSGISRNCRTSIGSSLATL